MFWSLKMIMQLVEHPQYSPQSEYYLNIALGYAVRI